jgi:hypothetical protein
MKPVNVRKVYLIKSLVTTLEIFWGDDLCDDQEFARNLKDFDTDKKKQKKHKNKKSCSF